MGPLLLARLMGLNETQEGVLNIAFRYADDNGLLLLDLADLQATLMACAEHASELAGKYGNVSKASVGTIQRQLLAFESQGADKFFGEPAFEINDFIRIDEQGRGVVNVLCAAKLMQSPQALCHLPALALERAVRGAARSGRPGKAQPRVLL
jgi:DNA helicase HerA-like ATPase